MIRYNVLIAGSREFNNYQMFKELVSKEMERISADCKIFGHTPVIISGGARGADKMAERFAKEFGYDFTEYPADWNLHGKAAGFIRNKVMVERAAEVLVFWDYNSKGTKHTIDLTKDAGKNIKIFRI